MNVLVLDKHTINKDQKLYLYYKTFPYPPFGDYKVVYISPNINKVTKVLTTDIQEGDSIYKEDHFTFNTCGKYKITIKDIHYNKNRNIEVEVI